MSGSSLQFVLLNTTTIENLSRKTKVWQLAVHIPDVPPRSAPPHLRTITFSPPVPSSSASGPASTALPPELRTFAILHSRPGENPWDLGPYRNFKSVMGDHWYDWLLPIKHSPCARHDWLESEFEMGPVVERMKREAGIVVGPPDPMETEEEKKPRRHGRRRRRRRSTQYATSSGDPGTGDEEAPPPGGGKSKRHHKRHHRRRSESGRDAGVNKCLQPPFPSLYPPLPLHPSHNNIYLTSSFYQPHILPPLTSCTKPSSPCIEDISPEARDIPIISDTNYLLQAHVHAHRHAVMAVGEGESFRAADRAIGAFRVRAHGALVWGEGDGIGVLAPVAGPGVVGGGHGGDWAAGLPVRLVVDELVEVWSHCGRSAGVVDGFLKVGRALGIA
ncbi:MAG: hypothetical protein LQ341_001306 [Variospora aurantia]|nr:MAG: hypothetical protein LQ341_001306 [Variospora aurantia]